MAARLLSRPQAVVEQAHLLAYGAALVRDLGIGLRFCPPARVARGIVGGSCAITFGGAVDALTEALPLIELLVEGPKLRLRCASLLREDNVVLLLAPAAGGGDDGRLVGRHAPQDRAAISRHRLRFARRELASPRGRLLEWAIHVPERRIGRRQNADLDVAQGSVRCVEELDHRAMEQTP
ncbi:MAG: hypothetical protein HOV80_07710 [Polyangiaceae bacterium]|nr:hypothetical protein [Polyangiaceae bacterium]